MDLPLPDWPLMATNSPRAMARSRGQWQVSGEVKVGGVMALFHGRPKLAGSWKAWRAADGDGIDDALTLTDAGGTTVSDVHFTRRFSRADNCWKITGHDTNKGALPPATARRQGDEIIMTSSGTTTGRTTLSQPHALHGHHAAGLSHGARPSYDDGKTWDSGAVTLDVRRAGA